MAEAAVERPNSSRFYCHQCSTEVTPNIPEYTCSRCQSGFIELMNDEAQSSSTSPPEIDPAIHFAELWGRVFLDQFRNHSQQNEQQPEAEEEAESQPSFTRMQFNPRARISFRRSRSSNRNPYLDALVNYFISREPSLQGMPMGMFHLHGNPGDYAWGAGGLDTIISQLLNQLDATGAPPADKEKIDALPTVKITQEQFDKNLQCSICMEDFKLEEQCRRLPCDHHYHSQCITQWLELHGTCPVCRKDLNGVDTTARNSDFSMPPPGSNSGASGSSSFS